MPTIIKILHPVNAEIQELQIASSALQTWKDVSDLFDFAANSTLVGTLEFMQIYYNKCNGPEHFDSCPVQSSEELRFFMSQYYDALRMPEFVSLHMTLVGNVKSQILVKFLEPCGVFLAVEQRINSPIAAGLTRQLMEYLTSIE